MPCSQSPLPAEVNETKINELQNRISELQREQLVAQNALTQQTRLLGVTPTGQPLPSGQLPQPGVGGGQPQQPTPEDLIQTERKKRAYLSLFASNVALSYRSGNSATPLDQFYRTSRLLLFPPQPTPRKLPKFSEAFNRQSLSLRSHPFSSLPFLPRSTIHPHHLPRTKTTKKNPIRRKRLVLPPRPPKQRTRQQGKHTSYLKGVFLKLYSSTGSKGSSPGRLNVCSQRLFIPTTANTC